MFIQTEAMPDPQRMKFFPGETVLASGSAEYADEEAAERSPLASRLFEIDGINAISLYSDSLTIVREQNSEWQTLKPLILGAIMDHFTSGQPAVIDAPDSAETAEAEDYPFEDSEGDAETIDTIHELLNDRVRPAAEQMGGDVHYKGYKDGVVYVEFIGPTSALTSGMSNVFAHYLPEIIDVRDFRDAIPKPGLETEVGRAIQAVLDEKINPAVAGHGGHISLIDVKSDIAYIRLEGGCQGCGMADVTLKQGVEVEIKSAVPSIMQVLDATDHAGGNNPYYAPGKG